LFALSDEVDAILHSRLDSDGAAETKEVNTLLGELDGVFTDPEDRLIVVGCTNRPWALDEAALRRFGNKIFFDLPTDDAREKCVQNFFVRHARNVALTYVELRLVHLSPLA
jgi:SpoVK/Ycf46/Vps4 family AAA+-type ATPase